MRNSLLLLLFVLSSVVNAQQKDIVGYYPSWRLYDREGHVKPSNLKYDRITTLNYAFFAPDVYGNISGTDAWADTILLRGEHDWNKGGYLPNTGLIDLAHQNGVKVFVSIGGWTLSDNFSSIAADPVKRKHFALECVRIIRQYDFDGIDIDWEYPGYAAHGGKTTDKTNFTLLLTEIRKQLDLLEPEENKQLYLTAAVSASPIHASNMEVDKIKDILDYMNIMTYDFAGTWDSVAGHNSPLFTDEMGRQVTNNIDAAFKLYNETYAVPADKINIGLAFYGRSFTACGGIGQVHGGPDLINFPEESGAPMYHQIYSKMGGFTAFWENMALVPFLIGKNSPTVVTFDDENSICLKCDYVLKKNARGVLIWEITGDYLSDYSTPLQDQIQLAFNGYACEGAVLADEQASAISVNIFPNPASSKEMKIKWSVEGNETVKIVISDLHGKILSQTEENTDGEFSLGNIIPEHPAIYIAEITAGEKKEYRRIVVH